MKQTSYGDAQFKEDVELLKNVCTENETYKKTLNDRLVIVSDAIMSYFAKYACSVDQHVCINDETGIAKDGALFNIETVPTDTLFYSELFELRSGMFQKLSFSNGILQFGGDASTGLGFCNVSITDKKAQ